MAQASRYRDMQARFQHIMGHGRVEVHAQPILDGPASSSSRDRYAEVYRQLRDHERRVCAASMAGSVQTESDNDGFEELDEVLGTHVRSVAGRARPSHEGVDEYDPPRVPTLAQRSETSDEMSFMDWYPQGTATLSFPGRDGIASIHRINFWIIEKRSQLLGAAFESSRSGPQLYLETLSPATAIPFLRYLYTGSYAVVSASGDHDDDVPTSVLLHCQLYRLADMYDLTELKSQAYVNVLRQCEFGCSSPQIPIELCAAVRYCYQHLREEEKLIDAIVHYCVSCFLSHRLAADVEFRQLAFELRPFHQALCRNVMDRGFEDEAATAIIQMPFRPHVPETYASREDRAFARVEDVVYHFHSVAGEGIESSPKNRKPAEVVPPPSPVSSLTLALRPKEGVADVSTSSEEEGCRIVRQRTSSSLSSSSSSLGKSETSSPAPHTEDEFDVVDAPGPVEAISSSEDDTDADIDNDAIVEIEQPAASAGNGVHTLAVRSRAHVAATAEEEPSGDPSDSDEWTLL